MKLLTWNVDGLCSDSTLQRARVALRLILNESPDLIFLQEVIPQTEAIFSEGLLSHGYESAAEPPPNSIYFTMTYYKVNAIQPQSVRGTRIDYRNEASSRMGRDILFFRCMELSEVDERKSLLTLNSHLESEKASSVIRTAQLRQLLEFMIAEKTSGAAILGGDLNMRDAEAKEAIQSIRDNGPDDTFDIVDAYAQFGKPRELSKTWLMPGNPTIGCRFDRIYHNCHRTIEFRSLGHVGTEKIPSIGMTPSDHFGLLLDFDLQRKSILSTRDGLVLNKPTLKKNRKILSKTNNPESSILPDVSTTVINTTSKSDEDDELQQAIKLSINPPSRDPERNIDDENNKRKRRRLFLAKYEERRCKDNEPNKGQAECIKLKESEVIELSD